MEKKLRLTRNRDFAKVYQHKQSTANHQFVVYKKRNQDLEKFRVGISASKKLGNAVVRNRIRRVLKEIVRNNQHRIKSGFDIVIIVRAKAIQLEFAQLEKSLLHALRKASLLRKE